MNRIYIVQHCQSEHHINELTGGWTDTPLTDLGKKQAEAVANELKLMGITNFDLFSSDLKRAYMTAEFISNKFNLNINIRKSLREINNGVAVNKTKEWANNNKLYKTKKLEIDKPLWQSAETPRELHNRVSKFIKQYLTDITKDVIIVSHGVAIGYLISSWLGIPPNKISEVSIRGNAGGISCIRRNSFDQFILTMFNSTSHLRDVSKLL